MGFNADNNKNERRLMAQQKCKKCGNWFSEEGSEPKVCSACSPIQNKENRAATTMNLVGNTDRSHG